MTTGIRPDQGTPSAVHRSSLEFYKPCLQNLFNLTRSCRTPLGKIKILQNTSGGNLTLTSSSKRLFQALSIKKPIIQLLVSSAQGHLEAYSDGGLFLTTFASNLVLRTLDSNLNCKVAAEVYEALMTFCLAYLNSKACKFRYISSVSDINFMKLYVKSILVTKPLCCLIDSKLDYVIRIVLETFLQSVSDGDQSLPVSDKVYTICANGTDVTESRVFEGLLLPAPELSKYRSMDIRPKYADCNDQKISVALVTVSLSGDLEELSGVSYEVANAVSLDTPILEGILEFCDFLIQSGVGLVLCQKVVHPRLKLHLRSAGVVVVDRLGLQPLKYVTNLSGCLPIYTVCGDVSPSSFGSIDNLQHKISDGKSYLHLTKKDNPVTTVMLFHKEEQAIQELKDIFITSLESLQQLLYTPAVFAGGGCWQAGLTAHVMAKMDESLETLSAELNCKDSVIIEAGHMFAQSLLTAANLDLSSHKMSTMNSHVFLDMMNADKGPRPGTCCCGIHQNTNDNKLVELSAILDKVSVKQFDQETRQHCEKLPHTLLLERNIVLDGFTMCLNAVQTAVLSACTVLRIGQVVENL